MAYYCLNFEINNIVDPLTKKNCPMNKIFSKILIYVSFVSYVILFNVNQASAQAGNFIQFWGGPQYVGLLNFSDYSATNLSGEQNIVQTYRAGAGFDYIHNFNQNYGLQTGLYYSGVGQKYTGSVRDLDNHVDTLPEPYSSHVYMDYIRIPFALRFNSVIDEDARLNLSIFFGFQLGYLLSAHAWTSPGPPKGTLDTFTAQNPNFNVRQLYNNFDFGLTAGAQFNYRIRDWEYFHIGLRFDRSITDIVNQNYVLPDNAPVEYQYPVSTKKNTRLSHDDVLAANPSQLISVNIFVGMSFRLKKITPPPHVIRDDSDNQ